MTCLLLIALLAVHPVSQDLSVAGLRKGLAGERSGLFMEQIRIVKEMRERDRRDGRPDHLCRPRYMVWENVPGAFSSNGGKDFQAVLTEIVKIAEPESPDVPLPDKGKWSKSGCLYDKLGGWSVAWRVHDAQFWGVPQRRKRIALVADFGGLSAPEICFERKGLSGDFEQGGTQREGTPEGIERSTDSTIVLQGNGIDRADTAGCNGKGWSDGGVCYTLNTIDRPAVYDASRRHSYEPFGEVCETVQAAYGTGGNNQPLVVQPIAIEMTSTKNTIVKDGICQTLTARIGTGGNQDNAVYCTDIGFFTSHEEKAGTLLARQYKDPPVVNIQKMVRRLTPTECERLQGFPDGWTDIGEWTDSNGKKHKPSDSPRYKALGNSIALPFWFYLLRRISAQYERDPLHSEAFLTGSVVFRSAGNGVMARERHCGHQKSRSFRLR